MYKKMKKYDQSDGSSFPVDSPEYKKWLDGLEPVYRELMEAELQERAREAKKSNA